MARLRTAFVSGTTLNNPLAIGDVTLSSAALSSLAVVTAPDYALVVLDPGGVNGTPEVITVTAHTAAATTATITRASEGSTARAHPVGTSWVHGATTYDFLQGPQIVGSNSSEQTSLSTSAVDLLTISNLNIPVTSGIRIIGVGRKSTGAASAAGLGLKLNATTIAEAASAAITASFTPAGGRLWGSSAANQAEDGPFWAEIAPRSANYLNCAIGGFANSVAGVGGSLSSFLNGTNVCPNATITSITIRGISGSGSVTIAVKEVIIYEIKYALGL